MADRLSDFHFLDLILERAPSDIALDLIHRLLVFCASIVENKDKRDAVPKIFGYAETVLPTYSLDDFRYHYRISRASFEQVLATLGPHLSSGHSGGALEVEPSKQLLVFLWYMSTQESMREVCHTYGIAKSTTHSIIYRVMAAMCTHMLKVIQWPDEQQQQDMSDDIQREYGLAGIVGYMDGTHVRLAFSLSEDQDYINRKGFPSIQLQIVVDGKMRIIHAYAGWPGCTHDARVLRNSGLYRNAEAGKLFAPNTFIIGDSAYHVRQWLITPFKDNGRLHQNQRRFNRKISSMRQILERTIGHIKCRFRRLRCILLYDVEAITKVILCGCILHNVCVLTGDELGDFIEADPDFNANNFQHVLGNAAQGIDIRNRLMAMLN